MRADGTEEIRAPLGLTAAPIEASDEAVDAPAVAQLAPVAEDTSAKAISSPPVSGKAPTSVLAGLNVLVVDDSVPILKMMSSSLSKKAKAVVTQAKDGLEAVAAAEKAALRFDVILTDIQMPHLDGFEESRRIRAMEQERGLPPQVHSTQVHQLYSTRHSSCHALLVRR